MKLSFKNEGKHKSHFKTKTERICNQQIFCVRNAKRSSSGKNKMKAKKNISNAQRIQKRGKKNWVHFKAQERE